MLFRVKEKSFIDTRLVEAGDEVEMDIDYDPTLHPNLEPIKPARRARADRAEDSEGAPAA